MSRVITGVSDAVIVAQRMRNKLKEKNALKTKEEEEKKEKIKVAVRARVVTMLDRITKDIENADDIVDGVHSKNLYYSCNIFEPACSHEFRIPDVVIAEDLVNALKALGYVVEVRCVHGDSEIELSEVAEKALADWNEETAGTFDFEVEIRIILERSQARGEKPHPEEGDTIVEPAKESSNAKTTAKRKATAVTTKKNDGTQIVYDDAESKKTKKKKKAGGKTAAAAKSKRKRT